MQDASIKRIFRLKLDVVRELMLTQIDMRANLMFPPLRFVKLISLVKLKVADVRPKTTSGTEDKLLNDSFKNQANQCIYEEVINNQLHPQRVREKTWDLRGKLHLMAKYT